MSIPVEAVLRVHLFVQGYKYTEGDDSTNQSLASVNGPVMNWILSHDFKITYAPVADLLVEFLRSPLDTGASSEYGEILSDARRFGQSPVDGKFRIQSVRDWTFSVADQKYRAECEVEVPSRDIARVYREQLLKGYGFEDVSPASLS